jgi:hypothetical protein
MAIRQPLVNSLLMQNPQFPNNNLLSLLSPTTVPQMNPGGILTSNLQAPMVAPTTAPTPAPALGLLDPSGQDRATAFLKGLGAAGPALMAAGAPTTDPGGRLKGIAAAAQARQTATNTYLQNERARKAQAATLAVAQAKAAREKKLFDIELARKQGILNLLKPRPGTNVSSVSAANQLAPRSSGLPNQNVVPATSTQVTSPPPAGSIQFGGMNIPQSVVQIARLSDEPEKALTDYVTAFTKPGVKYNSDGSLTLAGKLPLEELYRKSLAKPLAAIEQANTKLNAINVSLGLNTGVGDLAAINMYQRLIDDAVVRGEDVKLIQESQSFVDTILTKYQALEKGEKLGVTLRKQMKEAAKEFVSTIVSGYSPRLRKVKSSTDGLGLDFNRIWFGPDFSAKEITKKIKPSKKSTPYVPNIVTVPPADPNLNIP